LSDEIANALLFVSYQGQRRSSLSGLLAGGDGDEVAEWSDSMATPPLKISSPAAGLRDSFKC